jgi:hypothetical protein
MDNVISSKEAAIKLGIRPQTLRVWRLKGIGPRYIRYGGHMGRVVYRITDIEDWLTGRTFDSTSQETANASR